jgi:uncharacterized protein (TIGR00255 family)
MNSMTGFGRAEADSKYGIFTVEVSSVNNRFLELFVRLPRNLTVLEPQVREMVNSVVQRGKVSLFVNLAENGQTQGDAFINMKLAASYYRQLQKLKRELKLKGDVELEDLLMLPDVTRPASGEMVLDEVWPVIEKATAKALKAMVAMRAREGKAMAADVRIRLKTMATLMRDIEKDTADSVKTYASKLSVRIDELLNGRKPDQVRLEEEIAIFAERTDITEECIRFSSHMDQFLNTLKQTDAIGRRLNFILQELNREVNTIGSKASDFGISAGVISLKEEIEKLREQVQNVE